MIPSLLICVASQLATLPLAAASGGSVASPLATLPQAGANGATVASQLATLSLAAASGGEDKRDLTDRFHAPAGAEVRLWAESPQLFNPTDMDIDERGRIWITEGVNYRKFRNDPDNRRWHDQGDRIVILEDTDGDGACDSSKVFVQEEDLVSPLGICVVTFEAAGGVTGRQVIVSNSPDVYVYTDEDGDDVPDRREVLLTGFGGRDHDHGVHALVVSPDGRWTFNAGNAGPHQVNDRSGFRLHSGSLHGGGGGHRSSDGRVWTGGLILTMERDATGLRVLADNFRNPYEVAVDSFGDLWISDNDDDGNRCCRTLWVMEGGDYGYCSRDGRRTWSADRKPDQPTPSAHWHQDDPGVMPAGAINGAGGPTGVTVYEGSLFGASYAGTVLNCDAGARRVYGHLATPSGAGFELATRDFLASRLEHQERDVQWFRPSDVCVGPQGEVYVADWYDPGVGGHAAGDREAYGRILRVASAGFRVAPRNHNASDLASAVESLRSPSHCVRVAGADRLRAAGEAAVPAVAILAETGSARHRARALWILAGTEAGRGKVEQALQDPDPRLRIAAARALRAAGQPSLVLARALALDPSPAVRREAAVFLRDVPLESSGDLILKLARAYDGKDRFYLEALGIALESKEEQFYADLSVALGDSSLRWSDAFADLTWRLHPTAAVAALTARALSPDLGLDRRLQALDTLAFAGSKIAAEAMITVYLGSSAEVQHRALYWLKHRDENDWSRFGVLAAAGLTSSRPAKPAYQGETIEHGFVEIDVDVSGAQTLWLVVDDAGDGISHDWADWGEARLVAAGGRELRLSDHPWMLAESGWGEVRRNLNTGGGPLKMGGVELAHGIGTHADSEIAFPIPEGFERFRARAGVDDQGRNQTGSQTSVRFALYLEPRAEQPRSLGPLRDQLLDPAVDEATRLGIAQELALDPAGGVLLLDLAERGKLDAEMLASIAPSIFRNPDVSVRALASQYFPRKSLQGKDLPSIERITAIQGDVDRGRSLFFGERSTCSTCHSYGAEGGDIGPDLLAIREKYDRAAVLDAILNPSAAISHGYESWLVATHDGEVLSGFLLADGEKVVIKDTQGKRHVLPKEEIRRRKKVELSTMPDNVALGLKPQELADLVEFLLEGRSD